MEPKKGQRYSKEFRRQAVERMNSCGNIVGLALELGICRRVLYRSDALVGAYKRETIILGRQRSFGCFKELFSLELFADVRNLITPRIELEYRSAEGQDHPESNRAKLTFSCFQLPQAAAETPEGTEGSAVQARS